MAQLQRPLTPGEWARILDTPLVERESFLTFLRRNIPQIVYYDSRGKAWMAPPHIFLVCTPLARSPSVVKAETANDILRAAIAEPGLGLASGKRDTRLLYSDVELLKAALQ